MDLNKLYYKHQLLRMQCTAANSDEARETFDDNAAEIAGRIGQMQHVMGAAAAASWTAIAAARVNNGRPGPALALPIPPMADETAERLVV